LKTEEVVGIHHARVILRGFLLYWSLEDRTKSTVEYNNSQCFL